MLQNQATDPLAQLRDIHLPAAVNWWPLAPGWWGVGALIVGALVLGLWWRRKRHQRYYQRVALRHLERLEEQYRSEPETLVRELSPLLRRAAALHYPDSAGLTGAQWLEFLDRTLDAQTQTHPFRDGVGTCLGHGPYRPALDSKLDTRALVELSRRWLKKLPPLKAKNALHVTSQRKSGGEIC